MARVIHVISSGGLYGAERTILGLIKSVKEYDHHVVCFDKPSGSHTPFIEALKTEQIPVSLMPDGYGALRYNAKALAKLSDDGEPLNLHAHGYKGTMTCCYTRKFTKPAKIVCTQHGFTNKSYKTRTFTKLESHLIKGSLIDHVICASNAIRSFYLSKRVATEKLSYIANSVEIPSEDQEAPDYSSREIDLLYLGRLSPEKGPDILIDAISSLSTRGIHINLAIAGDGPLMDGLQKRVFENGFSDSVNFLGFVNDAAALLKRARWLVMPSRTEGLPMSALEAMSHHTPIIATRVGELPSVIGNDISGYLIQPEDASDLATTIEKVLNLNEDAWHLKSRQAYKTVSQHYSLTRYGREIAAIYDRVFASDASSIRHNEASLANGS